jgi:NAD(P)-dependent dehydrogenase (short-subunit alcohol dehydrogenase family)
VNPCNHARVVITGASSGIGRATTLHLARSGLRAFAGVRKQADGDALKDAAPGCDITPLILDVTDQALIASAAEAVAEHTGPAGLAGLVNNAGIGVFSPVELTPLADFRRLLEVNVTGQLAVTQAFLSLLRLAQGRILMIGSIGVRFIPPYVYLVGKDSRRMATMVAVLPTPLLDALRRRRARLPAPGSLVTAQPE